MPEPTTTQQASTPAEPKQRCRHIKTGGDQCRSLAMSGKDFCWSHLWYRKPNFAGVKGYDRVALLEDEASIQLAVSQVLQGVLTGAINESRARTFFYGANTATAVGRLRFQRERWLAETKQQPEESVRVATNIDTDPLAPPQEYRGPDGQFEPYWSFSKYMYEQRCEEAGRPKPTCPADMPASGWMDEEEYFEDPAEWNQRYDEKIKAAREQAAAATAVEPAPKEPQPDCEPPTIDLEAVATPACNPIPGNSPEPSGRATELCPRSTASATRQATRSSALCLSGVTEKNYYPANTDKSDNCSDLYTMFFSGCSEKTAESRIGSARGQVTHGWMNLLKDERDHGTGVPESRRHTTLDSLKPHRGEQINDPVGQLRQYRKRRKGKKQPGKETEERRLTG